MHTHTHTHEPSTVTLAAHARRGLIIIIAKVCRSGRSGKQRLVDRNQARVRARLGDIMLA